MKQVIDYRKFRCRIFAKLQKAFYMVDTEIFLEKLNHYDTCSIKNDFLNHILQKQKRLFAVDEFSSKH